MRYLLSTCPATDAVMLVSEPAELPGGGPGHTIDVPCWAGCPAGTRHGLVELAPAESVAFLTAEAGRAQIAVDESAASRTLQTAPEAPQTASQPRESHPEDSPPTDSARMSGGTRISTISGGAL